MGPEWLEELARDFTGLGGVGVLTFLTVFAAGYLGLRRRGKTAWFLMVSILGGTVLSKLLKHGFDRPRPELVPHGSYVYTASFPSGHSMMAAVVYLTLGAILAQTEGRNALRAWFLGWCLALTMAVGLSRVYLGVHWPTDVLAGWAAGAAWAAGCWILANLLRRKGNLEPGLRSE